MIVSVYTTHEQSEQPLVIHRANTFSTTDGVLTIEAYDNENGYIYSAFHRFEPGKWARFEVTNS